MLLPLVAAGVLVFASFKKVPQLSVTLNGFTDDTLIISHFALADGPDLLNDSNPHSPPGGSAKDPPKCKTSSRAYLFLFLSVYLRLDNYLKLFFIT